MTTDDGLKGLTDLFDRLPAAIDALRREGEHRYNEGPVMHLKLGPKHYEALRLHEDLQKARQWLAANVHDSGR